ncbi:MAG TPA: hypothetical protein VF014_14425 [Casimicrobiaceae bacterium]|nr:hypothetical protein [Casimicrobiaceae bacterium]
MARLFCYKVIKEPPGPWEVQVEAPREWAGRFRSQDGVAWWSPILDRPLGEHHSNPGEDRILRNLQAIARGHELTQLRAVANAARELLARIDLFRLRESSHCTDFTRASDELAVVLAERDRIDRLIKLRTG